MRVQLGAGSLLSCIVLFIAVSTAAQPAGAQGAPAATPPQSAAAAPATEAASPRVTPYGVVFFNAFHNSSGSNNTDVPLWAAAGGGDLSASGRQSRFGLRVALPATLGAKATAVVEADFFGGFPAIGTGENFGQLRLRLANVRLDWGSTSLVAGQDWMVFAPANPSSLACAAIPLFAAGGNPWARLPQLRLERRLGGVGLLQLAALAPQSGDSSAAFLAQPNSGASARLPYLQARLALGPRSFLGSGKPLTVGLSAHYGRSRVTPTAGSAVDLDSSAGAIDWSVPVGRHVVLAGEAFSGRQLAGFQAGAFQGINPDAVAGPPEEGSGAGSTGSQASGPAAIEATGGWGQIVAGPFASRWSLSASYGIDDPADGDLQSATARPWRLRNQVVAAGVSCKASAQLSFGLEYRAIETRLATGSRKDRHLNLAAVLSF